MAGELGLLAVFALVVLGGVWVMQRGARHARPHAGAADVSGEIGQIKKRLEVMEQRLEFHDRWLAQHGGPADHAHS